MKKFLFIFLFGVVSIQNSFGQTLESMKAGVEKIYTGINTNDLDIFLDYTYPRVFEIFTREQMKLALKAAFEGSDEMKIKINNVPPDFKYGEIFTLNNQKFCFINHNLSMTLIIKEKMDKDEAEMMVELFKAGMKTDDVTYDKKGRSFTINKVATMIAISDEYTKNEWRYINKDEKNVLFKKMFSEDVIEALGL